MVKRRRQIITSPYGQRGDKFHKGVDLRCYNFLNWKKQPVVFPERCRVIRISFQEKWGYTVVVNTKNDKLADFKLKFIHLEKPDLEINKVYEKGDHLGWTTVTEYMKENDLYEHLHFETLLDAHVNPIVYFESRGFKYGFKK